MTSQASKCISCMDSAFDLAPYIDHTLLKATADKAQIAALCQEAMDARFAAVCVPPYYVLQAREATRNSSVKTATVIGFPLGYSCVEAKFQEVRKALEGGAQELDIVINLAALKSADWTTLEREMERLLPEIIEARAVSKLIVESGVLTEKELMDCCRFYARFPIQFLKTSSGFAETGATLKAVRLMRAVLPEHIQIKASGGIRDRAFALALVEAGAGRIGTSSSLDLIRVP